MNGRIFDDSVQAYLSSLAIPIVEDAAQSIGCTTQDGRYLGTLFSAGCFSLAMTKLISSGQGGFITTNDDELGLRLRRARTQGVDSIFNPSWTSVGLNFRLTDLHSSIAISQLQKKGEIFDRQSKVIQLYTKNISNSEYVSLVSHGSGCIETGPYIECSTQEREKLVNWMTSHGVEVRPFYPSLSSAPYLRSENEYMPTPNADRWGREGIYLPSGPGISDSQILKVCELLNQFSNSFVTD